jgi:hypothetical protein
MQAAAAGDRGTRAAHRMPAGESGAGGRGGALPSLWEGAGGSVAADVEVGHRIIKRGAFVASTLQLARIRSSFSL